MLLDLLEAVLPEWMFAAPRQQFSTLMAAITVTMDCFMEGIYQARLASMPGQVDSSTAPFYGSFMSVDALPFIGRDRRIRRGLNESPTAYALRLREWLQSWTQAATPWMLLQQLAGVLGPDAGTIRIVTAGSVWWTWDGTTITCQNTTGTGFAFTPGGDVVPESIGTHFWDWDSISNPPPYDQNDPSRFWVILYAPLNSPYETGNDNTFNDPGLVDDFWNSLVTYYPNPPLPGTVASPNAGTIGLSAPQSWVENVRAVIGDWKAAGLACAYVIVSFDPTAFNPVTDSTPTSVPNGTWAWHGWHNPSTGIRQVARFVNAEYIAAPPGGQRE